MVGQVFLDSHAPPSLVAALMAEPYLRQAFDDFAPTMEPVQAGEMMASSDTAVVVARLDHAPVGFIIFKWMTPICVKLAVGFLPGTPGPAVKRAIEGAIDLIFTRGGVVKVVAEIRSNNRPSCMIAGAIGFRREGINRASIMRNGQLVDQIYFGLCRSDWHVVSFRQ